jgi:hypothetical protein
MEVQTITQSPGVSVVPVSLHPKKSEGPGPLPPALVEAIAPYRDKLQRIVDGEQVIPLHFSNAISRLERDLKTYRKQYQEAESYDEIKGAERNLRDCTLELRACRSAVKPGAIWREEDWLNRTPRTIPEAAQAAIESEDSLVQRYWERHDIPDYGYEEAEEKMDVESLSPLVWEQRFIAWAIKSWKMSADWFGSEEGRNRQRKLENLQDPQRRTEESEIEFSEFSDTGFVTINSGDMRRWLHGWNYEEESDEEMNERTGTLMAKALHKKEMEGWTPEEQEAYQSTARRLHKRFIRWRRRRLTRHYWDYNKGMMRGASKEGLTKHLRETGKDRYHGHLPNYSFFAEHILPTVVQMADSVEEMEQIGRDAIEVFDSLMTRTWRTFSQINTSTQLMRDFFADHDPRKDELSKTYISTHAEGPLTAGQFKFFYQKYGKEFAKVVALHNGWRSDIYFGDGFDEHLPYGAVEHGYGRIFQLVPPEQREQVFKLLNKHLPWGMVNRISQMSAKKRLPAPSPDSVEGRVLGHLLTNEGDHDLKAFTCYTELVNLGLTPETAACIRPERGWDRFGRRDWKGLFGDRLTVLEVRAIPGIEPPAELGDIRKLIGIIYKVNALVGKGQESSRGFFKNEAYNVLALPQADAVERVDFSHLDQMREQMAEIETLCARPELEKVFGSKLKQLRAQVERAASLDFFRKVMRIGIIDGRGSEKPSEFLANTNPTTQMAITGGAFMASIGAIQIPGLEVDFEPVRVPLDRLLTEGGSSSRGEIEQMLRHGNLEKQLRANAALIAPAIERMIREDRDTRVGTMAGGIKLHTSAPMNGDLFYDIRTMFGLGGTPFRLIHADASMIIPALPSNLAPQLIIQAMGQLGVIDVERPEIQTTMCGGDWSQETTGIVCTSILLATERGVQYKPGAFETSHNASTDARIMARDAGIWTKDMPFHLSGSNGRTDKLGGRHYNDINLSRPLGTLANHGMRNGPFAPIWKWYKAEFLQILRRHGLHQALYQTDWVKDPRVKSIDDTSRNHEAVVDKFTGAWFQSIEQGVGIIDEVEALIHAALNWMEEMRPIILEAMPGELEKLENY